ncbi:unnamed protein product, partial [marine sediment metagenome]
KCRKSCRIYPAGNLGGCSIRVGLRGSDTPRNYGSLLNGLLVAAS